MSNHYRALQFSLAVHLLIIGTIFFAGSCFVSKREIVKIDLTVEDSGKESTASSLPQPAASKAAQPARQQPRQPEPVTHEVQSEKQAPLPEPVVQKQEPAKEVVSSAKSAAASGPASSREPSPTGNGREHSTHGTAKASSGSAHPGKAPAPGYSREQFFYIRDLVQKKALYPKIAQERSWEGQVVVSFVILADGSATKIKIVTSSGRDILDRSALDAVKKASPFPKPPAEVELKMPVTYRLL